MFNSSKLFFNFQVSYVSDENILTSRNSLFEKAIIPSKMTTLAP